MNKTKFSHKVFIMLFSFFVLTISLNKLFAQGPNASEAASFEPVDATDMVNLVTGDLSYVLPLLNIPSPEGGYPIALSYHAGIAMDQEASWAGLGWSLNPGAINRGVNGYPDDWGKTNVNEFFYDKGWEENYYSFGAGISFKGGLTVGLGLSWGSNQSLGGYVSASIGPGFEEESGPSIGGSIGINGKGNLSASVYGSLGTGLSGSIGTSGVGIGYGTKGNTQLGVNLNYNYNSGLSGGISMSKRTGTFKNKLGKYSGVGINFSSNGISINGKVNGFGARISNYTEAIEFGDYDIITSTSSFFIPAYIFHISYSHTKINYSLYKYNNLYTSGMLYPVAANKLHQYNDGSGLSRQLYENNFMDVNVIQKFGSDGLYDDLVEDRIKNDRNNLILPSYDNYSVNAQGLSGTISPYIHSELNLSARGRGKQNQDNEYVQYLNHDISEYMAPPSSGLGGNKEAVAKKYFTFTSAYNSFLRLETSLINKNGLFTASSDFLMKEYETDESGNFYNGSTSFNYSRKREGNFIETYTNKEIRENSIVGFLEASEGDGLLNRQDDTIFLDEGIGAFKITSLDGKTYHYSLPVYQFESFYKNFRNVNGNGDAIASEDENFFEIQKATPYATHWLLTAITGPDYIDNNNNGKVDKNDFGYWVEFDYGKWSDGYAWQTPNGRFEEISDKDDATKKTYSYTWGRKQIYYLDAIKTRTHTALFVKDIRKDNISRTNMNENKIYQSSKLTLSSYLYYFGTEQVHNDNGYYTYNVSKSVYDSKATQNNINFSKQKTLKLRKIILIDSKTLGEENFNKNISSLIQENSNSVSKNSYITKYSQLIYTLSHPYDPENAPYGSIKVFNMDIDGTDIIPLIKREYFNSQFAKNVIDINDIDGLNLESKASQVIEFNHDYSLAKNAPNTELENGRLTLKSVIFKGKQGEQVVPPYQFSYYSPETKYNKDRIDDWGYNKYTPQVWSLNEVTTPIGSKIKIVYTPDKYYSESAHSEEEPFSDITNISSATGNILTFTFGNNSENMQNFFIKNRYYRITYSIETMEEDYYGNFYNKTETIDDSYEIIDVGSNWIKMDVCNISDLEFFDPNANNCAVIDREDICIENLIIYGNPSSFITDKAGGGIRTTSINVSDGSKNIATTEYIYENGITSYAPTKEQIGVPYVSELPAPMVMYGHVKLTTKDSNGAELGNTVFKFETLEPRKEETGYMFSLGEAFRVKENQDQTFENGKVITNKFTIENRLGNLGRINSITSYNAKNQVLHKKENFYKKDLDNEGEIGVNQESHISYKRVEKNDLESFYVSSTSKIDYPSVLESTKVTQSGFSIEKQFTNYDFLTGQLLETNTIASDGTRFKTKTVPAYTKYPAMGSKVDDINNKNMLSQQAASYAYLLDENNAIDKVIGANATTWKSDWTYRDVNGNEPDSSTEIPVWRKHKSFVWGGDIDSDGGFVGFDIATDDVMQWKYIPGLKPAPTKWKQTSEVTRYDHFSAPLEVMDINYNYSSTKMCDGESKVMVVSNAKYTEMFYSGAEYISSNASYFDGEVKSTGQTTVKAHTGTHSVKASANQAVFEVSLSDSGKYKVSVWVDKGSESKARLQVGNSTYSFENNGFEQIYAGDWVLLNKIIDIPTGTTTVYLTSSSGDVYFDDFRLYPVASSMTSYVYNEWDELSYIIGSNNLAIQYFYDEAGRLTETRTEVIDDTNVTGGFKTISENNYNYKK